jgi:hypothetical protein
MRQYNKQILIRLKKEEYDKIKAKSDKYSIGAGAYCRMKIFNQFAFKDEL